MIVHRKLITPDGTELVSNHRHDFVTHIDKNGKWYMLDGGHMGEYYRMSANGDEKIVEIKTEDGFEVVRDYFGRWNNQMNKFIKLKYISDEWLQNIIDYFIFYNHTERVFRLFVEEKLYRAEKEIYLSELDMQLIHYPII